MPFFQAEESVSSAPFSQIGTIIPTPPRRSKERPFTAEPTLETVILSCFFAKTSRSGRHSLSRNSRIHGSFQSTGRESFFRRSTIFQEPFSAGIAAKSATLKSPMTMRSAKISQRIPGNARELSKRREPSASVMRPPFPSSLIRSAAKVQRSAFDGRQISSGQLPIPPLPRRFSTTIRMRFSPPNFTSSRGMT